MDKKFWISAGITALIAVVAVKVVAEPAGRAMQKSTNPTLAKLGSKIS